ncbi:MAG: GNAT family N-acetyltransferase [Pseudomonadales bacterium]
MNLDIRSARKREAEILDHLMQSYLAEFATFESVETDQTGRYVYPFLSHYWEDPNRYPFLIRCDGDIAGFALLRFEVDPVAGREAMELAEFFVLPQFRRSRVGTAAARHLFDLFPGRWNVRVLKSNRNAYPFWRQVISDYTGNHYNEQPPGTAVGGNYTFTFQSATDADMPDDLDDLVDY